jgi:hypothetical protein
MDVWEGMWWGRGEKFAIWVHGNRIRVRLMITINSKLLILYNICITIIIQYKFLYDLKLRK